MAKLKCPLRKGHKNGRTTNNEQTRNHTIGNHATADRETIDPERSGSHVRIEHPANQAAVASLPQAGRQRVSERPARQSEQQSPGCWGGAASPGFDRGEVSGFWSDTGPREAERGASSGDLAGKCAPDHDRGRDLETEASQTAERAPDEGTAGVFWGTGPDRWVRACLV